MIIGRESEIARIRACLRASRNVMLEGPVGVGKTYLANHVAREMSRKVFRVDGDSRYTEQKLAGWFDPPAVLKKGYGRDSFVPGPLVEAMEQGGILFINEMNRLPEGVQNVLLPAIDEGLVVIPRLGEVRAKPGFLVVATQNPKEFVATSHLSEALLDRFELVSVAYQSEAEEIDIVTSNVTGKNKVLPVVAVRLVRATRSHPRVRRGASVRAAISIAEIAAVLMSDGKSLEDAFLEAATLALPTRIELEPDAESTVAAQEEAVTLVQELVKDVLRDVSEGKKKT